MNRKFFIVSMCLLVAAMANAQLKRPKLVVGIVVDQMRAEYLYRFYDQYGEGGFKRLLSGGFVCRNTHINYVPSITGPGHASIYSGTTPRYHGIIGNTWYNRQLGHNIYCVDDSTEKLVGCESKKVGSSPRNLKPTNIADELKIATNQRAKVIAISLKDRAAILPGGHMADGAFWFDQKSGNFITSTFYMKKLPEWVDKFNQQKLAYAYLEKTWTLLQPEKDYVNSIDDDNAYEWVPKGKEKPVFPYNLKELAPLNDGFEMVYRSPYGNSLLTDFALATLDNAKLADGPVTNMLAISFSSTDAIGHVFGPMSKEINDTYIRFDKDLARLFDALDKKIGSENYVVFLTADHGVDDVPAYLADRKIPAGLVDFSAILRDASGFLCEQLGEGKWIEGSTNEQFYLNHKLIAEKKIDLVHVQDMLARFLMDEPHVAQVFTQNQIENMNMSNPIEMRVRNGFNSQRSGDVKLLFDPAYTDEKETTATHSSAYTFDTQIPLIWYGAGIKEGESFVFHGVNDIAPTLSMILYTKLPSACTGNPIEEVLNGLK
jgi:hypothetical protein